MGKMKQMSIDGPQRDPNADPRVYIINNESVTRELFIERALVAMYHDKEFNMDIRKQMDNLLEDGNLNELFCFHGDKYFSYLDNLEPIEEEYVGVITQTENIEETYPLKKYEVSYDVEVIPLTPVIFRRGRKWKRVSEIVEATRFRDAKEIIQEKFKNDPKERKIKSIDVSEVRG